VRSTSTSQGKKDRRMPLFSGSSQPRLMHRSAHLCLPPGMLYNGTGGTSPLLFANKSCLLQLLPRPSLRLKSSASLLCHIIYQHLCLKTFFRVKIMLLRALKSARGESFPGRMESRDVCAGSAIGGYTTILQQSSPSFEGQEGKCRICLIHYM